MTSFRRTFGPTAQMRANSWMLMTGSLGLIASTLPVQWLLPVFGWRSRWRVPRIRSHNMFAISLRRALACDLEISVSSGQRTNAGSPAWRLLGVAMPLTIAGVALLAWGPLGVAAPAALTAAFRARGDEVLTTAMDDAMRDFAADHLLIVVSAGNQKIWERQRVLDHFTWPAVASVWLA